MLVNRGALLARLHEASIGLASKETIEQSSCFVFHAGQLVTFNDNIMVRCESPLDFDAAVPAQDLLGMVSKCPDEEIKIYLQDGELIVKGKKWTAGIAVSAEMSLPVGAVPQPEKWHCLEEGVLGTLQQAARTCGDDEAQYLATCVHITPARIEGCDNYRLFRADGATGFPADVLVPAESIQQLEGLEITEVSIGTGWVHFKTSTGTQIAVRCSHEPYHKGIDALLDMKDPEKIVLPSNLAEMVERAEVFNTATYDAKVGVELAGNTLTITSRKDSGWYKEQKDIEYAGRAMAFTINPKFLVEILKRTRDVLVDYRKMKVVNGAAQFVVALQAKVVGTGSKE